MKGTIVYIKYKFKIEYSNDDAKERIIKDLVKAPISSAACGGIDGCYKKIGNGCVVKNN